MLYNLKWTVLYINYVSIKMEENKSKQKTQKNQIEE